MFLGSSKYIKDKTFYCGKSKNILFFPFNQFKVVWMLKADMMTWDQMQVSS